MPNRFQKSLIGYFNQFALPAAGRRRRKEIRHGLPPLEALESRVLLSGNIFVTTGLNDKIGEYTTSSGAPVDASLVSGFRNSIAVSGSDLFVATESGIGEYTTSGATVNAALVAGLANVDSIAVSGSDLFVVFSTGTIGEYTTAGATVNASLIAGLSGPLAIAVSGSNLFVASNDKISEYTTSGMVVNASLIAGLSNTVESIAVSGSDLFVDSQNDITGASLIGEYNTSGVTVNASLVSVSGGGGVAVSGSDLFVTTATSIGEYTTSGTTVNGSLVSGLDFAGGITMSGSDLFITILAGVGIGSIGEYDAATGATVNASLVSGLDDPLAIVVSGSDLFVVNTGPSDTAGMGTIGEYTTSGVTVNTSLISGLTLPGAIAVSGSDLFVLSNESSAAGTDMIGEYTTSGTTVNASLVTGLDDAGGITVSGSDLFVTCQNNILITNNGTIGEYTTSGETVNASLVSGLDFPQGIAVSGSDLFVESDDSSTPGFGMIGEYTTSGMTVNASLVSGLNSPFGVAVSGSDLFVTTGDNGTPNSQTIGEYTLSGATVNAPLVSDVNFVGGATPLGIAVTAPGLFAPIGSVGTVNSSQVKGWTIDQDTLGTAATVQIDIDGISAGTVIANIARPDLVPLYGTEDHGFTFTMPSLTPGLHRVDVFALDTGDSAPTLLASKEINTNQAPIGSFAAFNGSLLKGWAFDSNAGSSSIQIRYQIDGNAPQIATASVTRSDLTATLGSTDHGFAITLPQLAAGSHTVSVWAVDSTSDNLVLLGTQTATVANPTGNPLPIGSLATPTTTLVKGWAYDPTSPTSSISVRIDIDGVAGTPFLANVSRPDLTPVIGSPNHGFSQALSLSAGEHRITVYALDSTTSTPVLLGTQIVGDPAPMGSLGATNQTSAQGWAFAAGLAGAPATVRLDIDNVAGSLVTANVNRPDLTATLGGPNFGFLITMPQLLAGTHTAKVWIIDPDTLTLTLIGSTTFIST